MKAEVHCRITSLILETSDKNGNSQARNRPCLKIVNSGLIGCNSLRGYGGPNQLLFTITDISNSNCWYQQFELLISLYHYFITALSLTNCWYQQLITDISNLNCWYQQFKLLILTIRIRAKIFSSPQTPWI